MVDSPLPSEIACLLAGHAQCGVLSLGRGADYRNGADVQVPVPERGFGLGGGLDWFGWIDHLRRPIPAGQTDRHALSRPHQRRTSAGTEEYRLGHLDGIYVFRPDFVGRPRFVCFVAKHHQ